MNASICHSNKVTFESCKSWLKKKDERKSGREMEEGEEYLVICDERVGN